MKSTLFSVGMMVVGGIGVFLGSGGAMDVARERELNPLELKGSPYGEVLGMAMQDPVHMAWHGGQGHEHVLTAEERGGEGELCEVCGVVHGEEEKHMHASIQERDGQPASVRLKARLELLGKYIRQKNSPRPRSSALKNYEMARTKRLLQTAYDFDRTNYGNYNALNFFYVTNQRRGAKVMDDALALGRQTLKACERYKDVDPQDALTAASAAENIMVWTYAQRDKKSVYELMEVYERFAGEVANYEDVMIAAVESGKLGFYSAERQREMEMRFGTFAYSLREYKKKIDAMPRIMRYEGRE